MTNVQLYLSIGIPTLAVLIGILLNGFLYSALNTGLNGRMNSIDSRMSSVESRMSSLEARMVSMEATMTARFDLIMGKLMELDTRLSVLEDRNKR